MTKHLGNTRYRTGPSVLAVSAGATPQDDHLATVLLRRWGGFDAIASLIIALVFVAVLSASWKKWPDVLVDQGRELYVAWRLSEGDVLHRDVAYFNGPLSPHINAAAMSLFGARLQTVVLLNSAVLLVSALVLYKIVSALSDRPTALLASVTFLLLFTCVQLTEIGNFNWICPYNHEVTHGMALALVTMLLLVRFSRTRRFVDVALVGVVTGMVFLTKVEYFIATAASTSVGVTLLLIRNSTGKRDVVWGFLAYAFAAMLPPVITCGSFLTVLSLHEAFTATMGGWAHVVNRDVTSSPFYAWCMGTDRLGLHLWEIGQMMVAYTGLAGIAAVAFATSRWSKRRVLVAVVPGVVAGLGLWTYRASIPWSLLARPWPVVLVVLLLVNGHTLITKWSAIERSRLYILRTTFALFSLLLLIRIFFFVRFEHYGSALAMPATVVIVAAAVHWIPSGIADRGRRWAVQSVVVAAIVVACVVHQCRSESILESKQHSVGTGGDHFLADERGEHVQAVVDFLAGHARKGDALVVLPEGIMINYLTRISNPTPYVQFFPAALEMYGEQEMLRALRESMPEWVVLVHRDDSEYGYRFFGRDYALSIDRWISDNYDTAALAGSPPMVSDEFGIMILRRRQRESESATTGRASDFQGVILWTILAWATIEEARHRPH